MKMWITIWDKEGKIIQEFNIEKIDDIQVQIETTYKDSGYEFFSSEVIYKCGKLKKIRYWSESGTYVEENPQ